MNAEYMGYCTIMYSSSLPQLASLVKWYHARLSLETWVQIPDDANLIVIHTVLYCTVLYCTVMNCTILFCIYKKLFLVCFSCRVYLRPLRHMASHPYYIVVNCTVLYCTVLYCTVLYCTVFYYTFLYL